VPWRLLPATKARSTLSIGAAIAEPSSPSDRTAPSRAEREALLRALLLARGLERALIVAGFRCGRRGSVHQLTAAVSVASGLDPGDRLFLPHDLIAAHLARGMDPVDVLAARLGRAPRADGRGHLVAGIAPGVAVPLATGSALALGDGKAAVAAAVVEAEWLGDAATARALALARDRALPLVVLAVGSAGSAVRRIRGTIDRDRPEAVLAGVGAAVAAVRAGDGPAILYCAPGDADPGGRDGLGLAEARRDPLRAYEQWLSSHGFARDELSRLRAEVVAQVKAAAEELSGQLRGPRG